MQNRCNKTILTLFVGGVALLALSIPITAYTDNSFRSSSGFRGSHGISSGHRGISSGRRGISSGRRGISSGHSGLGSSKGKHTTHNSRSNHSVAIKHKSYSKSASKQKHHSRSASKQKHHSRSASKQKKHSVAINQKNTGGSASKHKNLVTHKNHRLTTNFKSQVNHTKSATFRPDKTKGIFALTKSRRSFKHPITTGQHKDNLHKKGTVFHTQHKQHISHKQHKQNISHSRHNQKRHHGHRKHHGHSSRFIFSPFVFFSYRNHYYPYSYYSGYYPYAYPAFSPYGYSSPAYSYEEPVYSTNIPYGIDSPGWSYLAQGNFQSAINIFAKDIESYPDAGIPKVGFALASAATGNLTKGVLAMREAFQIDPDSIHYLYFDEKVLAIINDLIEEYEYKLQQSNNRPDEAFMVSSLHYLKYDYGSAHEAINRAIMDGDKSPSMGELHRLVDEQFSNAYADKNNYIKN